MKLKRHALSALFAQFDLDQADLENLAIDITENGQQIPIALYEGKVLDGWNRYQACLIGKVDPITIDYEGSDPWRFVVSSNIARRHMTPQQIAAVYLLKQGSAVPNGTKQTVREVAKELGVGKGTAERISKVAAAEPEVKEAVIKGEASLERASKVAALPKEEQAAAIKAPPAERRAPQPQATTEDDLMAEGMDGFDPIEELEKTQNELLAAMAKIEKLEADDKNKELANQLDLNVALKSRLDQAMTTNALLDKELRRMGKQHAELRKILGIEDDRQIVASVKALKEKA